MPLQRLDPDGVMAVALSMRATDHAEIFATRRDEDIEAFVGDLLAGDPVGAVITTPDRIPVAALGGTEMWRGTWSVWMFASERWPEVAVEATRFARRVLWPELQRLGARRAECRSLAGHRVAHRWLLHLGARVEAVYPAFGRDGETFVGFVIYGGNSMCAIPFTHHAKVPKAGTTSAGQPPQANDALANAAAEQELRRLRSLYGRRSTILAPDQQSLGSAPAASRHLLGS
jgi:hypothetical protein